MEPGATALADGPVVTCAPTTRVARALEHARAAGARVVITGPGQAVRADELARAVEWGLGPRPVREIAWRELPVLPADASEIEARRRLLEGASLVLLRRAGRIVGVVDGERVDLAPPESSLQARLERAADRHAEARLWLLRSAGKIGEGMGTPVHAVGGFVRDLALGAESPDVDLVVEGDGVAFARCLGEEIGGTVLVHGGFGTASIEGGRAPAGAGIDGTTLGRVDVASARRERYPMAGALPDVSPAGLLEDLRRRDFSVNAMAMALAPDRFGHLVDPRAGSAISTRAGSARSARSPSSRIRRASSGPPAMPPDSVFARTGRRGPGSRSRWPGGRTWRSPGSASGARSSWRRPSLARGRPSSIS